MTVWMESDLKKYQPEVPERDFESEAADKEDIRRNVESAYGQAAETAEAEVDLEDCRDVREELETLVGRPAAQVARYMTELDQMIAADPVNGAYQAGEWLARNLDEFGLGGQAKPTKDKYGYETVKLPSGKTHIAQDGSIAHSIAKAMGTVTSDKADVGQLREIQKYAKAAGMTLREYLSGVRDFAMLAAKDPFKAAAKRAMRHGMPLDDEQAAHQAHEAARRQQEAQRSHAEARELAILQAQVSAEIAALKAKHSDFDQLKPAIKRIIDAADEADEPCTLEQAYHSAKAERRAIQARQKRGQRSDAGEQAEIDPTIRRDILAVMGRGR